VYANYHIQFGFVMDCLCISICRHFELYIFVFESWFP